mmetsp:Transcript_45616/g.72159  ORF Transcript_45616/g.72159 Transcript_45616/m.72159 type:complete len:249 (+) Transcript_45616:407-1153(+)
MGLMPSWMRSKAAMLFRRLIEVAGGVLYTCESRAITSKMRLSRRRLIVVFWLNFRRQVLFVVQFRQIQKPKSNSFATVKVNLNRKKVFHQHQRMHLHRSQCLIDILSNSNSNSRRSPLKVAVKERSMGGLSHKHRLGLLNKYGSHHNSRHGDSLLGGKRSMCRGHTLFKQFLRQIMQLPSRRQLSMLSVVEAMAPQALQLTDRAHLHPNSNHCRSLGRSIGAMNTRYHIFGMLTQVNLCGSGREQLAT